MVCGYTMAIPHRIAEVYDVVKRLALFLYNLLFSKFDQFAREDRYDLKTLIAFDAKALIHSDTTHFCLGFVKSAILHKTTFELARSLSLTNSLVMGRYTSVVFFNRQRNGEHTVIRATWHHPSTCPWGEPLPLQCKECKAIRSFNLKHDKNAMDSRKKKMKETLVYNCKSASCDNDHHAFMPDALKHKELRWDSDGKGVWLTYDLDIENYDVSKDELDIE